MHPRAKTSLPFETAYKEEDTSSLGGLNSEGLFKAKLFIAKVSHTLLLLRNKIYTNIFFAGKNLY
jgi:hypothetical protein